MGVREMRSKLAAVAVGVCLAVGACSTSTGAERPPAKTTAPTSPSTSTPSDGHTGPTTPSAPTLPALARKPTPAGAKAFVRYYVALVNYSWKTGNTSRLASLATQSCDGCIAATNGIDRTLAHGGSRKGGVWSTRRLVLIPLQSDSAPIVNCAVHVTKGVFQPASTKKPIHTRATTYHFDFHLVRRGETWHVAKLASA